MWIYALYRKPKKKWLYAFLILDVPLLLLSSSYLKTYWNQFWSYPRDFLISFTLAFAWTWLGPYLILRWFEKFEIFLDVIDGIPGSGKAARTTYENNVNNFVYNKIISVVWTGAVIAILFLSSNRLDLTSYNLYGIKDINYWVFLVCVGYVALQTSIFFHFILYSIHVIEEIVKNDVIVRTLLENTGKRVSLALIGEIISMTAIYFCSGFLFFPVMIVFFLRTGGTKLNMSAAVFILMGIFLILILVYLGMMSRIVTDKVQLVKDRMLEEMEEECRKVKKLVLCERNADRKIGYRILEQHIRQRIHETAKLSIDPIGTNQYINLAYGVVLSAFLPAVVSLLLDVLKG